MAPTFTELLKIEPHELTFVFELNKQSSCLLHLSNTTPHYVAFKVKTTSPKKYIVNPNNGIIKPHITCDLTVTMQAQSTPLPVDFSCKDKFLIQSTIVPLGSTEDCISSDLFVKDNGKYVEEKKVRVVLNTQPSCPDPELCPVYRDLKHESSNRIYVLKDKDKVLSVVETIHVAEENGLETAKDIEEDRKDEDVFPGCNENVVDRKQESDSVQLNLAKDFEELKSKLSIMDSKLREAEETIVKLNEEKLKDNLKAEGTILKLNEEKRKDNLEKYFLKQELELSSALTPEPLDGTNYVEWSLNAQNKIRGRKRWGYVSGTKPAPKDKKSEEYETWEDEDCMVKSWLLDSMTKDIRSLFIRLTTAKEIWDTAKETYLAYQDSSRAYQLLCEIISTRQNGGSVITYFGKLQSMWQEFDAIADCSTKDVEKYTKTIDAQRVYLFLAGLDSYFNGVRSRILATIPRPNLRAVYAMVCAEANRQQATYNNGMITERTSLGAVKNLPNKGVHWNRDNQVVTERGFKLQGYPQWHPK